MKNKKKKKKKKPYSSFTITVTGCKGKKGGCLWEGEPLMITKLKLAA